MQLFSHHIFKKHRLSMVFIPHFWMNPKHLSHVQCSAWVHTFSEDCVKTMHTFGTGMPREGFDFFTIISKRKYNELNVK